MSTTDHSETSEMAELVQKITPYISEIRKRIIHTAILFFIATLLGFVFYEHIIKLIINLLSLRGINLVFTSPFQFINLAVNCGMATGLLVIFPVLLYQILSFLKPALNFKEYRLIMKFLPISILLFLAGFIFGAFIMKWHIQLFLTKSISLGIGNVLDVSRLISTILLVSTFMGIIFQFPIVIALLTRLGIVNHQNLSSQRPLVYMSSLFLVILLPLDSILSDLLLALPIIVLYEFMLMWNKLHERRNAIKERNVMKKQTQKRIDQICKKLEEHYNNE